MDQLQQDRPFMQHAISIAWQGEGKVEPNPMVGCLLVKEGNIIGRGYHESFGGPHAEVNALASAKEKSSDAIEGSTAYVTLEPCSHVGKTGPCADALIAAKVARVVIGCIDPNPDVSGRGIKKLTDAGIQVDVGVESDSALNLLAPFHKRVTTGIPWIIAKWAMTIDGKIATMHGDSQWISNEHSRQIVQRIRRRVDGIMVGFGTADADDPMLTVRGEKLRTPTRIVVDSQARLRLDSKLATSTDQAPVILVTSPSHDQQHDAKLAALGVEVWVGESQDPDQRLHKFLLDFASRGNTNVMVEGGGTLMGALNRMNLVDEAHVFMGPKMLGGKNSITPVEGEDPTLMADSKLFSLRSVRRIDDDVYMQYRKIAIPRQQG
jgi:diaminohydroxyphosphoribosylaminopyrimidine deaminase/5-amino-6-(5-phosphoribosylamino)uracil reductase